MDDVHLKPTNSGWKRVLLNGHVVYTAFVQCAVKKH